MGEMVKRKAESSLDKGPKVGVISLDLGSANAAAEQGRSTMGDCSTEEGLQPWLTAKPVATGPVDVANREGSEFNIFWLLLERAGCEAW